MVRGGPLAREEGQNPDHGDQIRGGDHQAQEEGRGPEIGVEVRGVQEVHNGVQGVHRGRLAPQGQREREVRRIRGGRGVTGPGSD